MAYLRERKDGRVEIRESLATENGPRARTLAVFRGVLSVEVLDAAQERATTPFDREKLLALAASRGIPVSHRRNSRFARELLALLRSQRPIDPTIAALLKQALEQVPTSDVPEHLEEVAEWVGESDARRGEAMRGLLRTYGQIHQSREPVRERSRRKFPRFRSKRKAAA